MRLLILAQMYLVLSMGCASESDEQDGPSLDQFIAAAAAQGCANIVRCGSDNPNMAPYLAAIRERPDICATDFADLTPRHQYKSLVAEGTTRYDSEAGKRCLEALPNVCNETFHEVRACDGVFTGTVPTGGVCRSSIECAGDAFCDFRQDICGDGTCSQRTALGESCDGGECTHAGGPSACGSFGCLPLVEVVVGINDECGDIDSPESIVRASCGDGLFCSNHGSFDAARRCLRRVGRAELCEAGRDLCSDFGDACVPDAEGQSRCLPVTLRSEVNAPCGQNPSLEGACNFLMGLSCEDGKCVEFERLPDCVD